MGWWPVGGSKKRGEAEKRGRDALREDRSVCPCDPRVRSHLLGSQLVSRLEPEGTREGAGGHPSVASYVRWMFGESCPRWRIGLWRALTLTGSMSGNPLCATTLPAYATHPSSTSPGGRVIEFTTRPLNGRKTTLGVPARVTLFAPTLGGHSAQQSREPHSGSP